MRSWYHMFIFFQNEMCKRFSRLNDMKFFKQYDVTCEYKIIEKNVWRDDNFKLQLFVNWLQEATI